MLRALMYQGMQASAFTYLSVDDKGRQIRGCFPNLALVFIAPYIGIERYLGRPGSKRSIFQTSFLGLLSVGIHLNEVGKGQIGQNMIKIGLKGP